MVAGECGVHSHPIGSRRAGLRRCPLAAHVRALGRVPLGRSYSKRRAVLHIRTIRTQDFDCIVVRKGRDVIVYVAESLLSARAAASITRALRAAGVGR